jgi:hypothetical protein
MHAGSLLNDLWELNPVTHNWTLLPRSDISSPQGRSNFGFTRLHSSLVVFGGQNESGHIDLHFFCKNDAEIDGRRRSLRVRYSWRYVEVEHIDENLGITFQQ